MIFWLYMCVEWLEIGVVGGFVVGGGGCCVWVFGVVFMCFVFRFLGRLLGMCGFVF